MLLASTTMPANGEFFMFGVICAVPVLLGRLFLTGVPRDIGSPGFRFS